MHNVLTILKNTFHVKRVNLKCELISIEKEKINKQKTKTLQRNIQTAKNKKFNNFNY